MAWKYQRGGVWWIGYRHNGRQVLKSTGKTEEAEAQKYLERVELLFSAHRANSLTDELYRALSGSELSKISLVDELDGWLQEVGRMASASTSERYKSIANDFKVFLNASTSGPALASVTTADVDRYLLHRRGTSAAGTVNVTRKILSGFFKRAVLGRRLRENPATAAKTFKAHKGEKVRRRSFTLDELQLLYKTAPDDFWRYMILGGAYTGLRMGDLINLKWGNVDLARGFIMVEPDKTEDRLITIPIARPFLVMLHSLKAKAAKGKAHDYIWPDQAEKHARYKSRSGHFSNQFRDLILAESGLATKRSHRAGEGSGKRRVSEISFHCLRHYFISALKSNGGSQSVAKALAGHTSDVVNDLYTHVPETDLVKAVAQLPEFASV